MTGNASSEMALFPLREPRPPLTSSLRLVWKIRSFNRTMRIVSSKISRSFLALESLLCIVCMRNGPLRWAVAWEEFYIVIA